MTSDEQAAEVVDSLGSWEKIILSYERACPSVSRRHVAQLECGHFICSELRAPGTHARCTVCEG